MIAMRYSTLLLLVVQSTWDQIIFVTICPGQWQWIGIRIP